MAESDAEQRDNFFRLALLIVRVGNQKLREFFKKRWMVVYQAKTGNPANPWSDSPKDAIDMQNCEIKKLKFAFKDQQTFFDSGNTNTWDFTLLTAVLTKSSLDFVTKSSPESHAIEELKEIRDKLVGHAPNEKIAKAVFEPEWLKASNHLKTYFSTTQAEIDQVIEDVNKPIDLIRPMIKELLVNDEEIMKKLNQMDEKSERRHDEVLETVKKESQETRDEVQNLRKLIESAQPEAKIRKLEILMKEEHRDLLKERLKHFQDDIIATELLDGLACLSDDQKDYITNQEKNYTLKRGVECLIDQLEKCENGFYDFVRALRSKDLGHVAVLLDADCEVPCEEFEEVSFVKTRGSVVDFGLKLRIFKDTGSRNVEVEREIAQKYKSSGSGDCRRLRKQLVQDLQNIHFVNTRQLGEKSGSTDSVVFIFRVSQIDLLEKFWKMYTSKALKELIRRVLDDNRITNAELELFFDENTYKEVRTLLCKSYVRDEESSMELESAEGSEAACEENAMAQMEEKSKVCKVYLDGDFRKTFHLRAYQKELAEHARQGKNTIICAPTNSGKTYIAIDIAKNHLDKQNDAAESHPRKKKVIFVVNKLNLVLQQRSRFEDYLPDYKISDISSNSNMKVSLADLMETCDVIVLTAQVLVNALNDRSVAIDDISLLIFDECHHTDKEDPYNRIMMDYIASKQKGKTYYLPQVVGLTASLGVGSGSTLQSAQEHILKICANLDATSNITTVRDNKCDLEDHVTGDVPDCRIITVNSDKPNILAKEVNKAMEKIEKYLKENYNLDVCTTDRQQERYRQFVDLMNIEASINREKSKYACAEYLRSYHEALIVNHFTTVDDALKLLEDHLKEQRQDYSDISPWLFELCGETIIAMKTNDGRHENPMLKALKELIIQFQENEQNNSKGIVFCSTISCALAIKRWISESDDFKDHNLQADALFGTSRRQRMTQAEQESVIHKFKSGDFNVLISTSVGEEGLDISDCKYVIRYGVKANTTSRIQARGRIRAKEGTYVYLSDAKSRGADHELKNQSNEEVMNKAIEAVQAMDKRKFIDQINQLQNCAIQNRKAKVEAEKLAKKMLEDHHQINLLCRKCFQIICSAHDLRRFADIHHVVINSDVKNRLIIKDHTEPRERRRIAKRHKIYCGQSQCNADLGTMITVDDGSTWPCLKIKSLQIKSNEGGKIIKQWKDFPYNIQEAQTPNDLLHAQASLNQ